MPEPQPDRRRHARFALGLPVGVRLGERRTPVVVELLDISESGARFQGAPQDRGLGNDEVHVAERVAFGFILPDQGPCQAKGQVVRVDRSGQFVLALDDTNDGFVGFIRLLEAES
jgi:PilZ domain